jgi:hypothetical protein
MPGVSLSGENFGVLEDLRAAYDKASPNPNTRPKPNAQP